MRLIEKRLVFAARVRSASFHYDVSHVGKVTSFIVRFVRRDHQAVGDGEEKMKEDEKFHHSEIVKLFGTVTPLATATCAVCTKARAPDRSS